jgi:two-component system chemotaxis response regulator CheB
VASLAIVVMAVRTYYRNVVVVGASAGGVEALRSLVAGLPPDLAAVVVVVLHLPVGGTSALSRILSRAGPLPALTAEDGMPLRPGRVYVAPPGRHHLLVVDHHLRLSDGATLPGHRPAVDVLFRSAALAFGPRIIGVVLSGVLHDGAAGLVEIASRGGITMVQDPADARYRGMPDSALRLLTADHVLPAGRMGAVLAELTREPLPEIPARGAANRPAAGSSGRDNAMA